MEYQHGGDIYSQDIQMDYSANINPLGMPEAVSQALRDCLEREVCSLYPDSRCERLRQALGRHHGVEDKWIICGNGAADLIFGLAAALRPVRGLVTAPAFSEYEQALRSVGCRTDYYYLREDGDFALDAAGMCGCVQEAAERGRPYDVVFLCNPNNPTGIAYSRDFLRDVLVKCRECKVVLVVDECFIEFMDSPMEYTMRPFLEEYDNLFLLKAFTKTYAMAGLRLGYGLSSSRALLEAMAAVMQPWNVSIPAQMAGTAALAETGYVESARNLIRSERKYLTDNLRQLGLTVYDGAANFIFFKGPVNLGEACKDAGILLRDCSNYHSLGAGYFRIAVRTRKENELLVKTMQRIMGVS